MKRILAAIDHSESSRRAAELAAELAVRFDADLTFLTVARRGGGVDGSLDEYMRVERINDPVAVVLAEAACAELDGLRDRLARKLQRPIACEVQVGSPADVITSFAQRAGMDLVVMGHTGHGGLGRFLLGSVAKTVVDTASCPVLVVP